MTEDPIGTGNVGRGVWFVAPRRAELREEEVKPPQPDEIQVGGLCSLVSAGSEMNLYRGEGNLPSIAIVPTAKGTLPFPVKFAYQVVGEVQAVGENSGYEVGDRVFAMHPHQDRFNVVAGPGVYKLPQGYDPFKAAFMGLFTLALYCHLEVPVHIGDCVAVSGLGVIGNFCAYLARQTASKLIVIDPLPLRRARAAWIGADAVVRPEDARSAIQELSEGRGVDDFIETSGAPAALQMAIDTTGELGTITVIAWYGTRQASLRLSPEFHLRSQRIISLWAGRMGSTLGPRWNRQRMNAVALQHLAGIDVNQLITHRVPFARAAEAYAILDQHQADTLAVLLDYSKA
jgi:2-desacetyl-2-hydroxyethyl bacteriochlorophyllide A dehydrogenase